MHKMAVFTLLLGLLVVNSASHAQTVYRCQTPDGHTVFQQVPCGERDVAGDTDAQKLWREMRVLAGEGNQIISELGPTAAAIAQCENAMQTWQSKVQTLRFRVSEVAGQHPDLARAFGALQDCAYCRSSAASNCMLANRYLDRALSKLSEY